MEMCIKIGYDPETEEFYIEAYGLESEHLGSCHFTNWQQVCDLLSSKVKPGETNVGWWLYQIANNDITNEEAEHKVSQRPSYYLRKNEEQIMNKESQTADIARNHIAAIFDNPQITNRGDEFAEKVRRIPMEVLLSPPPSKIEPKIKTTLSWSEAVDHITEALIQSIEEDDVIQAYESMFPGSDLSYEGDNIFTLECCINED